MSEMEKMTFEQHKSLNITHVDWHYELKNTGLTPAKNILFKRRCLNYRENKITCRRKTV